MDLTLKSNIKNLLKKQQTKPLKRLGQNFLVDKSTIKKVIKATSLKPTDIVLEIGPGLGILTQELARQVKKVIAVEKDPKMGAVLKETLRDFTNVEIINKDILRIENGQMVKLLNSYKIIANLPFYITAPVIRKFLESKNPPQEMVLIIQKEVAQRICAKPPHMNLLAVSVQFYSKPKIISYISKKSFWPSPKVDSTIIKISPKSLAEISTIVGISARDQFEDFKSFRDLFFRIVKAGFSQPRKQLVNNLSKKLKLDKGWVEFWLLKNDIKPNQRAETLNINNWIKLTETFKPSPVNC